MKNKLILITGGSSGIGKAAAIELNKQGAKVILQARNLKKLQAAATEISSAENPVSYYSTDLTNEESVRTSAKKIIDEVGIPDVVINSAGSGEWLTFKEATVGHYKSTIDSPYLATAFTCKVFYDHMQSRGNGHFIIINSAASYFSFPGATGYTPARWAMLGFFRGLQADLYNSNFDISLIALGKVSSPYFENNPISEDRIPKIANWLVPTLTTQQAGQIIAQTVNTKRAEVIKPYIMSVFVFFNRIFPGIFRWLMRITSEI